MASYSLSFMSETLGRQPPRPSPWTAQPCLACQRLTRLGGCVCQAVDQRLFRENKVRKEGTPGMSGTSTGLPSPPQLVRDHRLRVPRAPSFILPLGIRKWSRYGGMAESVSLRRAFLQYWIRRWRGHGRHLKLVFVMILHSCGAREERNHQVRQSFLGYILVIL
ncbi:hypothetical protein N431DRAFT_425412 [Stipitochalara longipes BDJ]|nr:hypothetical protein N431DRAFT_425412 [Stipitochalara longipes BDJ]